MTNPFAKPYTVWKPSSNPDDYGTGNDGMFRDRNRQFESISLQLDPMSSGQFDRFLGGQSSNLGSDIAWTGGAYRIQSETELLPADEFADPPRPADWIECKGRLYRVISCEPWDDDALGSYEIVALLMRPQPTGYTPIP